MSFERIGPYQLTRSDQVAASLVISFLIGAPAVRLKYALFVAGGLVMMGISLVFGAPMAAAFWPFLLLLIFVIGPALRSNKDNKEIYLDYSPDGVVAETAKMKTTYKWATILSTRKVGSRLFVMISDGCALVISDRTTPRENMDSLIATVAQHQGSASI